MPFTSLVIDTELAGPITASASLIPVKSIPVGLCASLSATVTGLIRVSDGTKQEIIEVNGCTGSALNVAARGAYGTVAAAFPFGCVKSVIEPWLCKLIADGGCYSAPVVVPPSTCTVPKFVAGVPFPEFEIGTVVNHAVAWAGDAPFTTQTLVKPSWMTVTVTGNIALLSGTPLDDSAANFQLSVRNTCGSAEINTRVCYCEAAGGPV